MRAPLNINYFAILGLFTSLMAIPMAGAQSNSPALKANQGRTVTDAPSANTQGTTANGCTYRIINGKYFVNCPNQKQANGAPAAAPNTAVRGTFKPTNLPAANSPANRGAVVPAQPPQSYSNVGSIPAGQQMESPTLPKNQQNVPVLGTQFPGDPQGVEEAEGKDPAKFGNLVYGGIVLGRTNFIDTDNLDGDSTGFGVEFGTNLTEHIGIALGYSFQKVDLFLGLEDRSGGAVITPFTKAKNKPTGTITQVPLTNEDSTLIAHIISAEAQLHLTNARAAFRPFAGLGLGYKISSIEENFPAGTDGASNSSMQQNAFGLTAGVGSKYRLSKAIQLGASFRFFIPVSSTEPIWSTKPRTPGVDENRTFRSAEERERFINARNLNLFDTGDSKLTESALSQLYLSVNYLF